MEIIRARVPSTYYTHLAEQFVADILPLVGDARLIWLPAITDVLTSTDRSINARVLTHATTQVGRVTKQGLGYMVSHDSVSDYITTPDTANLSFGDATNDSAFSIIVLGNQTASASNKTLVAKYGGTTREWLLDLDASEKLRLSLYDESLDVTPSRSTDAAVAVGSVALWVATYSDATGGATAANDITLYQNGIVVASTATNAGTYVAMEDTAAAVAIGATSGAGSKHLGTIGNVVICQKVLTAAEVASLYVIYRDYYDL